MGKGWGTIRRLHRLHGLGKKGQKWPRLNFPGETLFNWVKRSEIVPVELPGGTRFNGAGADYAEMKYTSILEQE